MVSVPVDRPLPVPIHPAHAFLLAAMVTPFIGAALCDDAYNANQQVQWTNFASWLLIGGLVPCGIALVCAIAGMLRVERRSGLFAFSFVLLLATFVLGVVDEFIHARDAWASMPTALLLSVIVAVLACVAAWIGFSSLRAGRPS